MGDEPNGVGGHDGIWYRYAEDDIVTSGVLNSCNDTVWRWVNQPSSKKRSEGVEHHAVKMVRESFHAKVRAGKTEREAVYELAMEECDSIEKLKITDEVLAFVKMNGGDIAEFERICDKADAITEKKTDKPDATATSTATADISNSQSMTPVWVIAVACVGSVIGVIIIVIIIIIIVKRRNKSQEKIYVQM